MATTELTYQMTDAQNKDISETIQKERGKLLGFIRKRVKSDEDAQDILQDVFYQFIQIYRGLETIEKTSSWLYRVARNRITDSYRKKRESSYNDQYANYGEDDLYIEELLPLVESNTPEVVYTKELVWEVLNEGLEELPSAQRDVFVWHELEGKSFNEIAVETGDSVNTLLSRKRYAVTHLRAKMNELFDEIKSQ